MGLRLVGGGGGGGRGCNWPPGSPHRRDTGRVHFSR